MTTWTSRLSYLCEGHLDGCRRDRTLLHTRKPGCGHRCFATCAVSMDISVGFRQKRAMPLCGDLAERAAKSRVTISMLAFEQQRPATNAVIARRLVERRLSEDLVAPRPGVVQQGVMSHSRQITKTLHDALRRRPQLSLAVSRFTENVQAAGGPCAAHCACPRSPPSATPSALLEDEHIVTLQVLGGEEGRREEVHAHACGCVISSTRIVRSSDS